MSDEIIGRMEFQRPSYRVIRCKFADLESQMRRRTAYDLVAVTQWEDEYTLVFRLKPSAPHDGAARLLRD